MLSSTNRCFSRRSKVEDDGDDGKGRHENQDEGSQKDSSHCIQLILGDRRDQVGEGRGCSVGVAAREDVKP